MFFSRAVIVGTSCFFAGWVLVVISGHGGNSTGGSELAWRVGGIMVYLSFALSFALLLVAAVSGLVILLWSGLARLRRALIVRPQ